MNILNKIGNTPLMNIDNIYFKLEMFNPSGSIKDRVAKAMILDYDNNNNCNSRTTIVEATSGNTGVSIAMVCATLGLKCKICTPMSTSRVKVEMMKAYGAKVYDVYDTITECVDSAKVWCSGKNHHYLDQFNNKNNLKAQINMASEAFNSHGRITGFDAIVAGVGTGGTLMGLHSVFPHAEVFTIQVLYGENIEGICDGVKLPLIPRGLQINSILVTKEKAIETARWLAQKHGIHCGISSGANYYASTVIKNKYKRILTVLPDSGNRYL